MRKKDERKDVPRSRNQRYEETCCAAAGYILHSPLKMKCTFAAGEIFSFVSSGFARGLAPEAYMHEVCSLAAVA